MGNKWFRRIRWFIELFTAGGSIYSKAGIEARVDHYGGFEVPPKELKRLLHMHLDERERLRSLWIREQILQNATKQDVKRR